MYIDRLYKNLLINFMVMMLPVHVNAMQQESRPAYRDLLTAAKNGNEDWVKLLLENNANVDAKGMFGETAQVVASEKGHLDIVKMLLKSNADVDANNDNGWTALMYASDRGFTDIADVLIQGNADVDVQNNVDWTALICASDEGHLDSVKMLLKNNADVEAQNNDGETALMCASFEGHLDIVEMLLINNADVDTQNYDGETPIIRAIEFGYLDIVKILLTSNVDINTQDNDGKTALAYAVKSGKKDVLNILLEYINVNTDGSIFDINTLSELLQNATGVLRYKKKNEIVEMVMMFIRYGANFDTEFDGKAFIKKYFPKNTDPLIEDIQKGINEYRVTITKVLDKVLDNENTICLNVPTALKQLIISFVIPSII